MQPTPLSLLLSLSLLSSVLPRSSSILVSPLKPGYRLYDSVRLSCEDQGGSGGWKVKRSTRSSGVRACLSGWGSQEPGGPCVIRNFYPSDVGSYWCESDLEERGPTVNITIVATPFYLHTTSTTAAAEPSASSASPSPLLHHNPPQTDVVKGNSTMSPEFTESVTEGATVKDPVPSSSSSSPSVLRVLCHVVVSAPYLVSTVLLGLIYRDRRKAAQVDGRARGRHDVIMEIVV